MLGHNRITLASSFIDICLGESDLVLVLLLVLGELGALEVWLKKKM